MKGRTLDIYTSLYIVCIHIVYKRRPRSGSPTTEHAINLHKIRKANEFTFLTQYQNTILYQKT